MDHAFFVNVVRVSERGGGSEHLVQLNPFRVRFEKTCSGALESFIVGSGGSRP
jgi:hypothetical protein